MFVYLRSISNSHLPNSFLGKYKFNDRNVLFFLDRGSLQPYFLYHFELQNLLELNVMSGMECHFCSFQ